jgi:hypothetical protein
MSDSLADVAHKFGQVKEALDGSSLRAITTRVGAKSKTLIVPAISPNTLSHWGRGGKTVKARYDVKSDHLVEILPTMVPLAALLEKGSGTTWKAPRRKGSARRRKGTVGSYTRTAVPARHVWSNAAPVISKAAPGLIHDEVSKVLGRVF